MRYSFSTHKDNIQILATVEMYKLINNLLPPIMNRAFKLNRDIRYIRYANLTIFSDLR